MRKILERNRKKGILTGNALSLILGGLALVGLVILGVKLYNSFVSQDDKNAQEFLNSLNERIKSLKDGEVGNFALRGVKDYSLVAFNDDEERPDKCFFDNCLCVCPSGGNIVSSCQEGGFCREVVQGSVQFSSAEGVFKTEKISKLFDRFPEDREVDAAFALDEGRDTVIYLISGTDFYKYRTSLGSIGAALPGQILQRFTTNFEEMGNIYKEFSLPEKIKEVDAVSTRPLVSDKNSNERIYFYSGNKYYSYSIKNKDVEEIDLSDWGLTESVDGAVHYVENKQTGTTGFSGGGDIIYEKTPITYFFRGDSYYRYDHNAKELSDIRYIDPDKLEEGGWRDVPSEGIDSVFKIGFTYYFFEDKEYHVYKYLIYSELSDKNFFPLSNKLMEIGVSKEGKVLFISNRKIETPSSSLIS